MDSGIREICASRICNQGNFCLEVQNLGLFESVRQLKESKIPLLRLESGRRIRNPEPGIRNPHRGTQNQSLYWITLHGASCGLVNPDAQSSSLALTVSWICSL